MTTRQITRFWLALTLLSLSAIQTLEIRAEETDAADELPEIESAYQFKESPSDALTVLEKLSSEFELSVSPDERSLFDDAADGQLDSWSLAEAALLASGVEDSQQRKRYLEDLNHLSTSASQYLASNSDRDAGERLLRWMHAKPLKSGYEQSQTLLSTVLDKGLYNCVSSAVLYSILGRELGLDVRGVEVPDHAFAVLYNGEEAIDIETTTEHGYNPARSRKAAKEFAERTGFAYIPVSRSHLRRETSALGLVALIYYNRGVEHSNREEYFSALLAYFRALSLDREADSAVKNALASISNWGLRLANTGEYAQAHRVLDVGLRLAPEDRGLNHNKKALWQLQINDARDNATRDKLLHVLRDADAALPSRSFREQLVQVLIEPAENLAKQGAWERSLQQYADVRASFPDHIALKKNEVATWHQWANHFMEREEWSAALRVYEKALQQRPREHSFQQNIAFAGQQWLAALDITAANTSDVATKMLLQFPDSRQLIDAVANRYKRSISYSIEQKQFEQGTNIAIELHALLNKPSITRKPLRFAFDAWGHFLSENGNYENAVTVYQRALQTLPRDSHLKRNAVATWHAWAKPYLNSDGCEQAIDIYQRGLQALPATRLFKQNIRYCQQQIGE